MKDTTPEMEKLQLELMKALTPNERIAHGSEMFMTAREMIIARLPKDLTEREKKNLYYKTLYGEPLPDDFFKDDEL